MQVGVSAWGARDSTRLAAAAFTFFLAGLIASAPTLGQQLAPVGLGGIWLGPKASESVRPKPAEFRSGEMLERALPTNTWYSSVAYEKWSGVLHAHPLTFKATESGMELGYPKATPGSVSSLKPWASVKEPGFAVTFPHTADFLVSLPNQTPQDARLHYAGDWNVTVQMKAGAEALHTHLSHGSPFGYFETTANRVEIALGERLSKTDLPNESLHGKQIQYFKAGEHYYGLYLPASAQVSAQGKKLSINLGGEAKFFAIGLLPETNSAVRNAYAQSAFAFVVDTEVQWAYDREKSKVYSQYVFRQKNMDGKDAPPLIGLYPHHQQTLVNQRPPQLGSLSSVRGPIEIAQATQFNTQIQFNGLMPFWSALGGEADRENLAKYLLGDKRRAGSMFGKMGNGTYWTGKALGAVSQLMNIAEQHGDNAAAKELELLLKQKMEMWLTGRGQSHFAHDPSIGSVLGYPEEYFSVSAMNDHHFHYGYWIMAAAHIARRDPNWAAAPQWGGMINLLVRDIATAQRKRVDFPFIRNFDVYEGHSWARGNSNFYGLGNDQESSSEALHAWAAVTLWGQATGQKTLEDLGVYLYATEATSVLQYWFNANGTTFHPEYKKPVASMVFGGGYGFSTWWTEEPRQALGINFLPITPGSTYLARLSTSYIESYLDFAASARAEYDRSGQSDGTTVDIWQDIFASVLALKIPEKGLALWNPRGSTELGDTRTRTFFWLQYLKDRGAPDLSVSANTLSYAVFKHPTTGKRSYVAYNPDPTPKEVRFSDGTRLTVGPKQVHATTQ